MHKNETQIIFLSWCSSSTHRHIFRWETISTSVMPFLHFTTNNSAMTNFCLVFAIFDEQIRRQNLSSEFRLPCLPNFSDFSLLSLWYHAYVTYTCVTAAFFPSHTPSTCPIAFQPSFSQSHFHEPRRWYGNSPCDSATSFEHKGFNESPGTYVSGI